MQDYVDLAEKNGVLLMDFGACQFCGAETERGIHECLEIFNLGFQSINYSLKENHIYRFLIVDSHTLQHPEIHGRWNNHFHLTRLHLMIKSKIEWTYKLSPKLSEYLNQYKKEKQDEYLLPPPVLKRGHITTTEILKVNKDERKCKLLIKKWAKEVYEVWRNYHEIVDAIAEGFLSKMNIEQQPIANNPHSDHS